jgi:O-antigen biosynthesis protein
VSVLIPTRDRPALVGGAIRSALLQDGVRVEVCVIDDASSTPLTLPPDLANDERVTVLRHDRPRGSAAARNTGLSATSGPLVAFLDDDDAWLPGKLRRQVNTLHAAGPGAMMVASGFDLWDGKRFVASVAPPADVNSGGLLAHPCVCPSSVLARREVIVAAGGFRETLARVEDWDLWLRMSDLGRIAVIPETLLDRRWHSVAPALAYETRRDLAGRIEPRLARLPAPQAAALRARFRADDAVLLATLGRRREAARILLAVWRDHPSPRAAPVRLARTLAGERVWSAARGAAAPIRSRLKKARRLPRAPGPSPVWAAR